MTTIAFTDDPATPIGQTRLYAGDGSANGLNQTGGDRTRTDAEIAFLLTQNAGDARAAGAELLEGKAAEYAQQAVRADQGHLRQDYRQRSTRCLEAAQALRANLLRPLLNNAPEAKFTTSATGDTTPGTMDIW